MVKTIKMFLGYITFVLFLLGKTQNVIGADQAVSLGEDPGPVYTQMVKQWANVTHFAKNSADVAVGKLKIDMQKDPKLQKLVTSGLLSDLQQFFYELFVSQEMMTDLAKLYSPYFTLDEMQEIVAFYKTPIGQKVVKFNTELNLKSQIIGEQLLKKYEREYMDIAAKYAFPDENKTSTPKTQRVPVVRAPVPANIIQKNPCSLKLK